MTQELLISEHCDLEFGNSNWFMIDGRGIYGGIHELSLDSQKYILNAFGIRTNLDVFFTEDSDGDIDKSEKIMGNVIALILQRETGDAIFFHVVDTPILKRVKGQISVVQESWSKWLTNALDEAGLKYKVRAVEEIEKVAA